MRSIRKLGRIRVIPANPPDASNESAGQNHKGRKCEHERRAENLQFAQASQQNFLDSESRGSIPKKSRKTLA